MSEEQKLHINNIDLVGKPLCADGVAGRQRQVISSNQSENNLSREELFKQHLDKLLKLFKESMGGL